MKYLVQVPEVHYSTVEVEARDETDALLKVAGGDGEEIDFEYRYCLDTCEWKVRLA